MNFMFSEVNQSTCITYFAPDPLRLYLDEPQKNEIFY